MLVKGKRNEYLCSTSKIQRLHSFEYLVTESYFNYCTYLVPRVKNRYSRFFWTFILTTIIQNTAFYDLFSSENEQSKSLQKKLRWATMGYHHNWETKVTNLTNFFFFLFFSFNFCVFIATLLWNFASKMMRAPSFQREFFVHRSIVRIWKTHFLLI